MKIPILTFHSIGIEDSSWSQKYLSSPLEHFVEFILFIKDYEYESIFLDDWYSYQQSLNYSRKKKMILTFDDGYLDNWVFVFPIIRKYGLKITIFVNPEFIDPSSEPRPTLEDVWNNKIPIDKLETLGFLNWQELYLMEKSGLVDIQSHSMTHNRYFKNENIIDFFNGSEKYDWLPWITSIDSKPYYMKYNMLDTIKRGTPIFENDRSLSVRRYIPNDEFIQHCVKEYHKLISRYESHKSVRKILIDSINKELARNTQEIIGRYESDYEVEHRYKYELYESKRIIEKQLGKKVNYLCWPGGRYNKQSLTLSIKYGYKASTATKKSETNNYYSEPGYKRIERIGMGSRHGTSRNIIFKKNNRGLINCFKEFTGSPIERYLFKTKRRLFQIFE
jgi:peptidoglycan/xylan/chitin deacetylase (PgdA/CDA1 family)